MTATIIPPDTIEAEPARPLCRKRATAVNDDE